MKYIAYLFTLLAVSVPVFPQQKTDSLIQMFQRHTAGGQIKEADWDLYHLRHEAQSLPPVTAIDYFRQTQAIAELYDLHYITGRCYSVLGNYYYEQALYFQAMDYLVKAYQLYIDKDLQDSLGYVYIDIGNVYYAQGLSDIPEQYYRKSVQVFSRIQNPWGEAVALNNIALVKQRRDQWDSASYYYHEALRIRQAMGNSYLIAHSYYYIGKLHRIQKQYDKAKKYLTEGERLAKDALQQIKEQPETLKNRDILFDRADINEILAALQEALGLTYREQGEYDKAIHYYISAVSAYGDKHKTIGYVISLYLYVSETYRLAKDLPNAEKNARMAIALSESRQRTDLSAKAMLLLSEILESQGRQSDALKFLRQYSRLKQEYDNQTRLSKIADYQAMLGDYENHIIIRQNEQELRLRNIQNLILLIAFFFMAVTGFVLFRFYRNKVKTGRELEEKNRRITEQSRNLEKEIEERKEAEAEVRKLAAAIEQSANTVVITDVNGTIEYVNPRFTQVTGYSAQEAVGQNPRILKSHLKKPEEYTELWKTILSGNVWRGLFLNHKKDGTEYWEEATITPIRNDEGIVEHFIAVKEDITKRKMTEEALQASEARYRHLIENMNDVLFSLNTEGLITYISKAMLAVSGYKNTDLLGLPFMQFVQPDDQQKAETHFRKVLGGASDKTELRVFKKNQDPFWISVSSSPSLQGGVIAGMQGIMTDITNRKTAEKFKKQNEFRLHSLLELSQNSFALSEKEIIQNALENAVVLTGSSIGYCHFINEDQQSIELVTWSKETLKECKAVHDSHYPLSQAGIWADCVRQRAPVVHNDYPNVSGKKGLPEGHSVLIRHMSVPVVENGQAKVIMGVGNKPEHYIENDVRQLQLIANDTWRMILRKRLELEREKIIRDLQEAMSKVKTLSGLLPICASCKKIRDDKGYWHQIENYIASHSDADFSHSICKECQMKLYPELFKDEKIKTGN